MESPVLRLAATRPPLQPVTGKLVDKTIQVFPRRSPKELRGEARKGALRQAGRGTSKVKLVLSEIKIDTYTEAAGAVSLPSRRAIQAGPRVLDATRRPHPKTLGLSRERDAYRRRNSPASSAQGRGVDEKDGEEKRKRKVKDQNCLSRIVLRPARGSQKKTFPAAPPPRPANEKRMLERKDWGVKMS